MNPPTPEKYVPPALPDPPPARLFIFSGHMVDTPTRPQPRFPPDKETAVQRRVAAQLHAWQVGANDLAISGAARGGDLLFAERCARLGAPVWLFLPRAQEAFLEESVRLPGTDWEARFHTLRALPNVRSFFQSDHLAADPGDGLDVHARNNLWIIGAARALAPSPDHIHALLVWDEKSTGDGPGGTSDFVTRVQDLGGRVAPPINPTHLSAEP